MSGINPFGRPLPRLTFLWSGVMPSIGVQLPYEPSSYFVQLTLGKALTEPEHFPRCHTVKIGHIDFDFFGRHLHGAWAEHELPESSPQLSIAQGFAQSLK